jgi:hypothetical protein
MPVQGVRATDTAGAGLKKLAKSRGLAANLAGGFDASPDAGVRLTSVGGLAQARPQVADSDLAGEGKLDYASDGFAATFSIPMDREQGI